jgi:quinol-cytochrome oxidoreductase complex cytochrome b subunit
LGSTPGGIKPEWYFFFVYYPLELLPFWVILLASVVLVAILMAAPWIFKGTSRKTLQLLAGLASIYLIVMTVFGEQIYEFYKH